MDSNQLSLDESVRQVMQTLPPVIREYLAKGKYTLVAKNLMSKYSLRIDQGGILERELMLLIMGIESPEEFVEALGDEAKIAPEAVGNIVQDINSQIFIPLQDEEKKAATALRVPEPRKPIPPPNPAVVPGAPRIFAPPPQSPMYPGQSIPEPTITFKRPISQSTQPSVPTSRPPAPEQKITPTAPATTNPSQLLEDHEEPHIDISEIHAPQGSLARTSEVPPNLPGTMPPQQVMPTQPKAPLPSQSYSVDPYREPLEGM
jgi:hypothetical protein